MNGYNKKQSGEHGQLHLACPHGGARSRTKIVYLSERNAKVVARTNTIPDVLVQLVADCNQGNSQRAARLLGDYLPELLRHIEAAPKHAMELYCLAAYVCQRNEQLLEAIQLYHMAAKGGECCFVLSELANLYGIMGKYDDALLYGRHAYKLESDLPWIGDHIAQILFKMGQTESALEMLRDTITKHPNASKCRSRYLWYLCYSEHFSPQQGYQQALKYAKPVYLEKSFKCRHLNTPITDRRLRIGYLCAYDHLHPVGRNLNGILRAHDSEKVKIYAYCISENNRSSDEPSMLTEHTRSVSDLNDLETAQVIRRDKVDILVSMIGHSDGNRLRVCCYRPAPIQVDYGSPSTTGLPEIDYRLTDACLDPAEMQKHYVEKFAYMPSGFPFYVPPELAPCLSPPPVLKSKFISFGSFNDHAKINDTTISLWGRVLKAVPHSRFVLKLRLREGSPLLKQYQQRLTGQGIDSERVKVVGWCHTLSDHLKLYEQVDIMLDTYPFNGGLTTYESLWMGVPTISLAGPSPVARYGMAIYQKVNLADFATQSQTRFIQKAFALAQNTSLLTQLRRNLRSLMLKSTLCDSDLYTLELEDAYRRMWHIWCDQRSRSSSGTS